MSLNPFSKLCNREMLEVTGECIIFDDFLPALGQWDHYTPTVTPHCLCYRAETLQVTNYNQTLRRTGCIWEISRFPGFLYICMVC